MLFLDKNFQMAHKFYRFFAINSLNKLLYFKLESFILKFNVSLRYFQCPIKLLLTLRVIF